MLSYEPLKRTLQKRKITLVELGKLMGISSATSESRFHSSKQNTSQITRICKALNCDIEDVVCWTKEPIQTTTLKKFKPDTYNVNWEKLYLIIQKKGMTVTGVSTAMGRASNFLSKNKKNNCRPYKATVDLICKAVGCKMEDFCDEV